MVVSVHNYITEGAYWVDNLCFSFCIYILAGDLQVKSCFIFSMVPMVSVTQACAIWYMPLLFYYCWWIYFVIIDSIQNKMFCIHDLYLSFFIVCTFFKTAVPWTYYNYYIQVISISVALGLQQILFLQAPVAKVKGVHC